MHKLTEEDIEYALCDEKPNVQPAIRAALVDAEAKGLYEFGMLTPRFFIIYQNFQMNTSINRSSFAASRDNISKILAKLGRELPKVIYEVAPFAGAPVA